MLYFGRQILIPLALALVLSFLLSPFVGLLERVRLGRVPSVLIVMAVSLFLTGAVAWGVANQLVEIMANVGEYKTNLHDKIQSIRAPKSSTLGQATASIKELNDELSAKSEKDGAQPENQRLSAHASRPIPVQITAPPSTLIQDLSTLIGPLFAPVGTVGIVIIFTAFTLIKREDLRNRLIRLGGQGRLHVMTQALDDASRRLSRYLWMQFVVNVCYGSVFGAGLYIIGIPHAFLWGALEALLRFIPYIGTLIGAAFPVALAIAVFPGWNHAIFAFGLFLVLESVVANILEPWLYGAHTGLSSLAILVAAVFWTMLWGPPGLILTTPLTLCLMLAGRYVPRLEFLEVVLGDEPVLRPEEHFYQRMLAMDPDEARSIAETYLREGSLESFYDTVLIPALSLAEQDRHMDAVSDTVYESLTQNLRDLIEDLGERYEQQAFEAQSASGISQTQPRAFSYSTLKVLCAPASDDADELVAIMLAQLLRLSGNQATHVSLQGVAQFAEQMAPGRITIACISAVPPFAIGPARSLCKRLKAHLPELQIVVGLWNFTGGAAKASERVGQNCSTAVTSLSEAMLQIRKLSELSFLGKESPSQQRSPTSLPGPDKALTGT